MGSIFDAVSNAEILRRVDTLGAESVPRWGKMDCAQMFTHCCRPFEVALGDVKLKRAFVGFLLGGIAKRYIVNGASVMKPNMATAPEFLVREVVPFDEAQRSLRALLKRFAAGGPQALTRDPHPFFGRMDQGEWDRLMWKHTDHHLRQFGA